jgi:hypothetical protein
MMHPWLPAGAAVRQEIGPDQGFGALLPAPSCLLAALPHFRLTASSTA